MYLKYLQPQNVQLCAKYDQQLTVCMMNTTFITLR